MSIITKMRKQTAVYWQQAAGVDDYGRASFEDPVEITCRWEDVREEYIDENNERQLSKSVIYVDRVMKIGDWLFLGDLSDLSDSEVPESNEGAIEVKYFGKLPNLKNTEYLLTVMG